MSYKIKKVLFWAPRIISIIFILFLSLFSLDVFNEGYSFWNSVIAFLIHLVPVFIVVILLMIAWKWEWIGAMLFLALSLFYMVIAWGKIHWSAIVIISGISALVGILFLLNWKYKTK